jgi:hypothetical protein
MDDRQPETVSDMTIDREIRQLLAVDPSPEFLVRVRTQIANEPATMQFPWVWVSAGAIAAVFMAVAVAVVPWRDEGAADLSAVVRRDHANFGETSPELREGGKVGTIEARPAAADLQVGTTDATATAADLKVSTTGTVETSADLRVGTTRTIATAADLKVGTTDAAATGSVVAPTFRSAGTKESSLPHVLISADDARAFREFVARLSERNFELSFDEAFDIAETPVVTALTIQLITTEPLNPSVSDEGAF